MALIHISVARQSSIRKQDLRKRVEGLLMADLEQVFEDVGVEADEQEEDARPPASPVPSGEPPVTDEQPRKPASPEPTGDDGEQSSENPASILRAIGSPG
jgi:hypothetical protein